MTTSDNNIDPAARSDEDSRLWNRAVELAKAAGPSGLSVSYLLHNMLIDFSQAEALYNALVAEGLAIAAPPAQPSPAPFAAQSLDELEASLSSVPPIQKSPPVIKPSVAPPWLASRVPRPAVWALGIALAILADWLFWSEPTGWTIGAYLLLLGGAIFVSRPDRIRAMLAPGVVVALLALACILNASSITVTLGFLALASMVVFSREGVMCSVLDWVDDLKIFILYSWQHALGDICDSLSCIFTRSDDAKPRSGKTLRAYLIASALSLIFLGLFALANPMIESALDSLAESLDAFIPDLKDINFIRIGQFLLFGVWTWMLMRFCLPPRTEAKTSRIVWPTVSLSVTDACLIVFNIVFLVQTTLDGFYLLGGMALPTGMTLAEYAHKGFYPLWTASMLAAVFMLVAWNDKSPDAPNVRRRSILARVWLAQNCILLLSALYRLYLYVCAYSLTHLRVMAAVGMILVLIGLASIAVRIVRRKRSAWLLTVNALSVLVMTLLLSLVNVRGRIAEFNVDHSQKLAKTGQTLDVNYLEELGPASLPALIRFSTHPLSPGEAVNVRNTISRLRTKFETQTSDWRGWTVRRQSIAAALDNYTVPKGNKLIPEPAPPAEPESESDFNLFDETRETSR